MAMSTIAFYNTNKTTKVTEALLDAKPAVQTIFNYLLRSLKKLDHHLTTPLNRCRCYRLLLISVNF